MDKTPIMPLVKDRLGIRSAVRDSYIDAIVSGAIKELEDEKGIVLADDNDSHIMFVVDYAAWMYLSRDESGAMPRHLQFRLHNLQLHNGSVPP